MNKVYSRIESITGSVITVRAEGVKYNELAEITTRFGKSLAEVNKIDGIKMIVNDGGFDTTKLFLNSIASNILSSDALYIYPAGTSDITTDDIRTALASKSGINVKQLGEGADAKFGTPVVEGAKVEAKVLKNGKGKKITVFTYRSKKDSKRKMGHRQPYTKVEIVSINA